MRSSTLMFAGVCGFAMAVASFASAQVYDNVDLSPNQLVQAEPGDVYAAQQFLLGSNTAVTSVALPLARVGSPTGNLSIEIWNDAGGSPGSMVGQVGTIDVATLPASADPPVFPPLKLSPITFSGSVGGLTPNNPYYVVVNGANTTITEPPNGISGGDSYQFTTVATDAGTNGADRLQIESGGSWVYLSDVLAEAGNNYMNMSVTAVPEPSAIVLALLGVACMFRLRRQG